MAGQNQIKFGISFEVDQSLKKLEQGLSGILAKATQQKGKGPLTPELEKATVTARQLSNILDQCYNKELGTVNVTKFNNMLSQAHLNLQQIKADLNGVSGGADVYNRLSRSVLSSNLQLKEGNKLLNDMATTMTNTLKWGVASSILNTMTGAIRDAYTYTKQLDTSLTDIRIVTGDSADKMARFAEQANTAAKSMGANTLDYTKAALSYYQQGLGDEAVANRTEATIKAANVTGSRASEVAENLTAVWNGFQAEIGSETDYVDKLAAVADSSASNLAELATAMSKVASVANNMGVDMDQLTAQISTIIATTRQAPETVGNALKTIYARINDIKTGSDEAEISLGNYTGKMASLGINVLDATGHLRDTGEVMEEIGEKWGTMGREQQIYLAQTMAGQRQMNNLVALFDNWTQYSDMLNVSLNAQGALDEKNNRYLESTQAHLNELKSTYQDLFSTLISSNEVNTGIDSLRILVQTVDDFLEGFGGGIKSITAFGTIVAYVFRDQIGNAIAQAQRNQEAYQQNLLSLQAKQDAIAQGANRSAMDKANLSALEKELALEQQIQSVRSGMTSEEYNAFNARREKVGILTEEVFLENQKLQLLADEQGYTNIQLDEIDSLIGKYQEQYRSQQLTKEEYKEQLQILTQMRDLRLSIDRKQANIGNLEIEIEAQRQLAEQMQLVKARTQLVTTGFMAMTTVIGSVSSLVRTFTNENATLGEKINQLAMTAGFAIPMLMSAYKTLAGSIQIIMAAEAKQMATQTMQNMISLGAVDSISKETAARIANAEGISVETIAKQGAMALLTQEQALHLANTFGLTEEAIATKGLSAAMKEQAATGTLLQQLVKAGIKDEAILTAVKEGNLAVLTEEQAARLASAMGIEIETLQNEKLNVALLKQIGLKKANAVLNFITQPQVLLIAAAAAAIWALVKAWDAQTNKAKEATQAAIDAKERASEVREGYDNLKTTLDDLAQKRSALAEMARGTDEWKQAVIELNEEVLKLLDTYPELSKYIQNQDGALIIDPEAYDEILDEQLQKVQASQQIAQTSQIYASEQQNRAQAQDLARDAGLLGTDTDIDRVIQMAEAVVQTGEQDVDALMELTGLSNGAIEALLQNTDGLIEINSNLTGIDAQTQTLASTLAARGGGEQYENSQYKSSIDTAVAAELQNTEANLDTLFAQSQKMGETTTELAAEYKQLTGLEYDKEQMTEEELRMAVVQLRSQQDVVDGMQETVTMINDLATATRGISKDFDIDSSVLTDALASFAGGQQGSLSTLTSQAIDQLIDDASDSETQIGAAIEEYAKQLGYSSSSEFVEALEQARDDFEAQIEGIGSELSGPIKKIYKQVTDDAIKNGEISVEEAKQVRDLISESFTKYGSREVAAEMGKTLEELLGKGGLGALDDIDWNNITPQELAQHLKELGVEGIPADQTLQVLIEHMREMGNMNLDPKEARKNLMDVVNGIGEDKLVDSEGIEALRQAGVNVDELFIDMLDGTYKLKGSAEEFKAAVNDITLSPFVDQLQQLQEETQRLQTIQDSGFDPESISGVQSQTYNGASGDYYASAGMKDQDSLVGSYIDDQTVLTAEEYAEIHDKILHNEELETEQAKALADAYDQVKPHLDDIDEKIKNNTEEAKALKESILMNEERDTDIDIGEMENLADYMQDNLDALNEGAEGTERFSDDLKESDAIATDVAESFLRFDDAIKDVTENYDDWAETLDNGSAQDQAQIMDELADAYGDMLDIDGDALSSDFLTNAENLDLMKQAAEGSEEAYDELQARMQEDILAHCDMDTSAFNSAKAEVQSSLDEMNFENIEIGADLDTGNFLAQLDNLVNAAGMTASQAEAYLASMGIDAEVVETNKPSTETKTQVGWDADWTPATMTTTIPTVTGTGSGVSVGSEQITFEAASLTYSPAEETVTSTKDNKATSLKVVGAHKSSGGNIKYKNASNGGGRGGKKGGGGGKGGKGKKGGGKGKKVEPAKKKEIKKDPYHDVNRQLGVVGDNLKKLQKEEKKLTGKQYLDNLVKQNQQLEKQRKLIKQKADIATAEVKRQQQELSRNYGFGFNSDGDISNYFSVLAKYQKQVEDLYNKAQKSPSETNNAKYQKATEDYDAMMKAIDAYEKDLDIYNKQIQDDLDALNDMIENNIKRFNYTIDLHLDTADFEKDLKEFRRDVLDQIKEDDYINLSSYGLSIGQDTLKDTQELVQHVKDIQNAIAQMNRGNYNASPYHDDMKSAMEDLQKYTEELMKRGEDIADIQEDIHDNWMDAIDDAQDAFDEQRDEYEQINDLIEHNLDMLEMLHGDEAYSQMANLYQQQADNSMKNIQLLAKERDFWFQQMNSVAEGSDAWKEYRKNWEDAVKDLNSGIKDTADYFYNRYEAIFNQLAKQLKDTFAGGDWNKRQTLWEDFLDDDDRYLDSLSRANGTYNLIQKTQEAISNANLKHQKELNKWLDATTKNLESQTELRQIDLDIAEKELDIILKRQALEDAQNNKTKMRLRRDSQGNYRYQYVADTNDVTQKQQELRDAIEDLRLLVKEDFKDTVDRMYDQMDSFAEEAAEISEKYGFNTEEWNDQMALLQERYIKKTTKTANDYAEMMRKLSQATGVEATELFGQMGDEFMAALGMDSDTYKVFEQMFKPGGEYVDLIDGFITEIYTSSFDGVAEDVKDTFNDVTNLLPAAVADLGNNLGERIRDMLAQFMSDASDNQQEYVKNLEDVQNETGQHFDDLTTNMEGTIKATEDLLLDNDKLITSYGDVINKVQEFADAIAQVVEQYKALSEAQINSTANTLLGNAYYQNGTTGVARYGVGGEDIRSIDENVDSISQVLRQLSSYDEGGWTGGGAELAVVHPNEYVLTSTDAPNMLAAAQIASQVMDRVADFKAAAMSQVGGAIGGLFNSVANADNSTTNEQQIIINADFPAVESAREIKQAFNELVNLASQRASGNRRTY